MRGGALGLKAVEGENTEPSPASRACFRPCGVSADAEDAEEAASAVGKTRPRLKGEGGDGGEPRN